MSSFMVSALSFLVAIGVLITVHEFGHFWVARRLGVKVLRFSVGFGKPLLKYRGRADDTEYVLAAIPLGGYVKMLDEHEGEVAEEELPRAFNRQPLMKRTAIVFAGPMFNFLFAIVAYALVYWGGIEGTRPVVGEVEPASIAALGGLQSGDELVAIDGRATPTWNSATMALLDGAMEGDVVRVEVLRGGVRRLLSIDLSQTANLLEGRFILETLGISPWRPRIPPVIDDVVPGEAADMAGLKAGDEILKADGVQIEEWAVWVKLVQAHPDKPLTVTIRRGGEVLDLTLKPRGTKKNDRVQGYIGAYVRMPEGLLEANRVVVRYGPVEAVGEALRKTYDMSLLMLRMLGKMVVGEASIENLSGPISIAQYAGQSASIGLVPFVLFLAVISVSLGVINLLPVPLLDGGHLFYYLIEFIKGSPLSESAQLVGQKIGIATLLLLMGLAFYNDLVRIFS